MLEISCPTLSEEVQSGTQEVTDTESSKLLGNQAELLLLRWCN